MDTNDGTLLAARTSAKSIVDTASHINADSFKGIDTLLNDYMSENQLHFQDGMTYEHFIQMSAIADNAVLTTMRKILIDSITSILYEASFQDDEDDD